MGKLGSLCALLWALLGAWCALGCSAESAGLFGEGRGGGRDDGRVHAAASDGEVGGEPGDGGDSGGASVEADAPPSDPRDGAAARDASRARDAGREGAPAKDPTDAWDGERAIVSVREEDCADKCLDAGWGGFEWTSGAAPYCVCRFPGDGPCDVTAPWSTASGTACPVGMACNNGATCSSDEPGAHQLGEECGYSVGYCRAGLCCPNYPAPQLGACEVCE